MYSGTTITKISGKILGAHQKMDRVARKQLDILIPNNNFPAIKDILKFEGDQGPDAIKRKSPFKDEPWHFFFPDDETDTDIVDSIHHHYKELVKNLKQNNEVKSAFEASWLAHAIVDGLTPAHHYPYTEEAKKLRGQDQLDEITKKNKIIMHGDTKKEKLMNNWRMWGPKGLLSSHLGFELGFASLIAPMSFHKIVVDKNDFSTMDSDHIAEWYRTTAQQIMKLNIYEDYIKHGWTIKISKKAKDELAPMIINAITAIWYSACTEASK